MVQMYMFGRLGFNLCSMDMFSTQSCRQLGGSRRFQRRPTIRLAALMTRTPL